jgi:hypothetical protein
MHLEWALVRDAGGAGEAVIDLILEAGALVEEEAIRTRAQIGTALTAGKTAIEEATTTGGLTQFPRSLNESIQRGVTRVGDRVRIPLSEFGRIGVASASDLYSFVTWSRGASMSVLLDYEDALRMYYGARDFDTCLSVCDKGRAFISSLPDTDVITLVEEFYTTRCMCECARRH